MVKITDTEIEGVYVIEPEVFGDERGYFMESFNTRDLKLSGKTMRLDFVQDNESRSIGNVVRGFHFQAPPYAQAKLVRCAKGAVYDMALDIRKGSPTYGKMVCVMLSGENHKQLYIPAGFAHAFMTVGYDTLFQYKCNCYYNKESEGGVQFMDLALPFPEEIKDKIMNVRYNRSVKDLEFPRLDNFDSPFTYGQRMADKAYLQTIGAELIGIDIKKDEQ